MAQFVGPRYGATDFDASRWRDLLSNLFGVGVVRGARPQASAGGDLAVTNPSTLQYSVATGIAIIKGFMYVNDTVAVTGSLSAADPSLPRIDTIVVSWAYTSGVPTATVAVKTGTPASIPVAPSLTQNDTVYEFPLADMRVNAAATVVASITDRRTYTSAILGYTVGHASGNIPISDGTVDTNLNADMVDGFHAGHATGQVAVADGTVVSTLNADQVDGHHASHSGGDVPISDGTVNTTLNADQVDGKHSTDLVNVGAGNLAATPVQLIIVGPTSASLPAAGTKGRVAIVVPFSLP